MVAVPASAAEMEMRSAGAARWGARAAMVAAAMLGAAERAAEKSLRS
jgi:hypothetical protein